MSELRIELLEEAIKLTSGARNDTYGPPTQNMRDTATLFATVTGINLSPEQAALFMVCVKLARLRRTPGHRDSYVDAMAYLGMAYQAHEENKIAE
jgi:hypothetical protein